MSRDQVVWPTEDLGRWVSGKGQLRCVVEQNFALLHQFKRLAVRWERRADAELIPFRAATLGRYRSPRADEWRAHIARRHIGTARSRMPTDDHWLIVASLWIEFEPS
ncbi:hypothetical protein [Streptomyces sp. XY332]|uniref:hypothetical protein n=1 Tax=Streptomyces sp. XY332 TaxID=1415561 RepID=UPI0006B228FB|nr:hypothetical protein ADK59_25035 [Streptomyces sp. XY332]